jgi:hypothetical protein
MMQTRSIRITDRTFAISSALYLLAGGLLSRLVVNTQSVLLWSVLSLPSIVLVPFMVGLAVTRFVQKPTLQSLTLKTSQSFGALTMWFLGILILITVIMILQVLNLFSVYVISFLAGGSAVYLLSKENQELVTIPRQTLLIACCLITLSVVPVIIGSIDRPIPLFGLDFDTPAYNLQPVVRAIQYNYFTLSVPLIDELLALIACFIFNTGPSYFFWFARFLLEAVFSIGVFVFVNKISRKPLLAFLSAIIAPYLMVGTMETGGFNLYFDVIQQHFRSNTIIFAIFPFLLSGFGSIAYDERSTKRIVRLVLPALVFGLALFFFSGFPGYNYGEPNGFNLLYINPIVVSILVLILLFVFLRKLNHGLVSSSLLLLVTSIVLWLMHNEEFIAFEVILLFYMVVLSWSTSSKRVFGVHLSDEILPKLLFSLSLILVVAGYSLNRIVVSDFKQLALNIPFLFIYQGASLLLYEVPKVQNLIYGNGPVILILLGTGVLLVNYRQTRTESVLLFMFASILFLYFVPLGWTYRLYSEIVPFMTIIVALPLFVFVTFILHSNHKRILRDLAVGSVLVLVVGGIAIPSVQRFSYHDYTMPQVTWQSYLSLNELNAASFIESNTPSNSIIVSDPFTVFTMAPLADRVSIYDKSQFDVNGLPSALQVYNTIFMLNQRGENISALEFNGVNSYVKTNLESPSGSFSIDLWAERSGSVNYSLGFATIAGWQVSNSEILDGIVLYPGNILGFREYNGNQTVYLQYPVVMQPGVWYNIAVTFANGSLSLYVDGTMVSSLRFSQSPLNSKEFDLGATVWQTGQNRAFNGSLSEVQVYERALSEAEVEALYSSPLQSLSGQVLWFNTTNAEMNSSVILNTAENSTYGALEDNATFGLVSGPLELYNRAYLGGIVSKALATSMAMIPYTELDFLTRESIKNLTVVLVISPRTLSWIESGGETWLSYYPSNVTIPQTLFPQFQNGSYFKLIYNSNSILIYEMTHTVAVPASLYSNETKF